MWQTVLRVALLILTAVGFLFSWLTGFSYGRYFLLVPLLLTAFGVSLGRSVTVKAGAFIGAVRLWGLFSFVLFGTVTLQTGMLIGAVVSSIAYVASFVWRNGPRTW
jgi:hypothetical protein